MQVSIRLFARAKDLAGTDQLRIDLPAKATVAELRRRLADERPELAPILPRCAVAVDNDFAAETLVLQPENEVALIPPVSGGAYNARVPNPRPEPRP